MSKLSHFDKDGKASMVDVSEKETTSRTAIAKGRITMKAETLKLIEEGSAKKGDVLGVARVAGIMGAKKTSDLIPLCHPLPISKVSLTFDLDRSSSAVEITAEVKVTGQTGVEMEALTAVSIAALTIYDMVKAADKDMTIEAIHLDYKEGGKSGAYQAEANAPKREEPELRSRPKARAEQVALRPDAPHAHVDKRLALQHFIDARRIKPLKWAKDAGVQTGALYSFLQGRVASLSVDDEAKLAASVNVRPEDLYPGLTS